jgi:hypothetical protein
MSTITERCAVLTTRLGKLRQLEALHGQAEQLEERRRELEGRRDCLAIWVARAEVLAAHEHLNASVWPDVAGAKVALARVREKVRADPTRIAAGRDYRNLLDGTDRAVQALKEEVETAWSQVRTTVDPVDERLLQRLAEVPGQAAAVDEVRSLRNDLYGRSVIPPATLDDYAAFMRAAAMLADAWRGLDHRDLPESVLRFFKAAQSPAGAPEALWTAEVRTWLDEHDMLNSVRLYFRGGHGHAR